MVISCCTLFYNNGWVFFIPVSVHHPQTMTLVSSIVGAFLPPVLQFLCVSVFLSMLQLEEAKSYVGGEGGHDTGHVLKLFAFQ